MGFVHDHEIAKRLNSLGLVSGTKVRVITGGNGEKCLVGVGNARIALEPFIAGSIIVQSIA